MIGVVELPLLKLLLNEDVLEVMMLGALLNIVSLLLVKEEVFEEMVLGPLWTDDGGLRLRLRARKH